MSLKAKPLAEIQRLYKVSGRGAKYGNGKLGGYPGLALTCKKIAEYIPQCNIFVEPFAGLGRISPLVKANTKVLNDKNPNCYNYNKAKFSNYIVTSEDFLDCIKRYDGPENILFIDPPWRYAIYENGYIDRKPKEYYLQLL